MALYKGVEIDDGLVNLIGRMGKVEEYQESLQSLQSVWDNLTLLGHLSGTGADMSETRTAFQQLTGSLLNQLGRETLKKTVLEMKSKAQVAVDIMIRNLFERTADIGFLAMDGEVRDYLSQNEGLRGRMNDGDTSAQAEANRSTSPCSSASASMCANIRCIPTSSCWIRREMCYCNWMAIIRCAIRSILC